MSCAHLHQISDSAWFGMHPSFVFISSALYFFMWLTGFRHGLSMVTKDNGHVDEHPTVHYFEIPIGGFSCGPRGQDKRPLSHKHPKSFGQKTYLTINGTHEFVNIPV